jgi:diguanylate cyclase (GGDEF)-like protein
MGTPGIRTVLALLVVGCILPIAAMATWLTFNFYAHEQHQLTLNAINRARILTGLLDQEVATTQASLQALGTSPLLAKGDFAGFHTQAVGALRTVRAESIVVVTRDGQLALTTRHGVGAHLPKLANAPLLKKMVAAGKPGVSDLFLWPALDRLVLTIAVPVQRRGPPMYSLNAIIPPTQMWQTLQGQKLPDSWRVAIVDSLGRVVARTHETERFLGRKLSAGLLKRIKESDEGTFASKTPEGDSIITAYSRSRNTGWVVAIGMPLSELMADLRNTLVWLVLATATALAAGLSVAWLISGRITRSIIALTKPALALGSGSDIFIQPLHFREANQLRQALIDAASALNQARHDAHHDALTKMANRTLFHLVVNQHLTLCRRNQDVMSVLYIDLDGFKAVNDTYGHALGDLLLQEVSTRVKSAIRDSDLAARLGGDEFAIALMGSDLENARHFAIGLIDVISEPYLLGTITATVSASIGVAGFPDSADDIDTLLKRADQNMYRAKESGKGCVCVDGRA